MRIAINGFGRIGRALLRSILEDKKSAKKIEVAVINVGPANIEHVRYMFTYDTIMGTYPGKIYTKNNLLHVDSHIIQIIAECEPQKINWKKYAIEWVVDCSGCFTQRDKAIAHLSSGAKRVLISAPAYNEDICIIPGVNSHKFDSHKHYIVSLGSCTANAFFTMLHIAHNSFSIECGSMTTVHAYTNSQVLLDVECDSTDVRRARAAALNIIPTTTGATRLISKVLPELTDKIKAKALRIPIGNASLINFTFTAKKTITKERINAAFLSASIAKNLSEIVSYSSEPLVSSDYIGNSASITIDSLLTDVVGKKLGIIFGWYDNEWGYSCRLKDFLLDRC